MNKFRLLLASSAAVFVITMLPGCKGPDDRSIASAARNDSTHTTSVINAGQFIDKGGQHTSGTYRIERRGNVLRVVLEDDFKTDEGPDLHVVLSSTAASEADSDNAMSDATSVVVGALASLQGFQAFDLPEETDLTQFKSVLIHCIQYTHLYGAAPLSKADDRTVEM